MKLMDKLKEFFGRNSKAPDSGISEEEQRQREAELVEKMQNPPVASYTNPNAPMTYQEMALLVPRDMWLPKHPKHRAVFGLLQNMTRFLEESRMISKQEVDRYKKSSGGSSAADQNPWYSGTNVGYPLPFGCERL